MAVELKGMGMYKLMEMDEISLMQLIIKKKWALLRAFLRSTAANMICSSVLSLVSILLSTVCRGYVDYPPTSI